MADTDFADHLTPRLIAAAYVAFGMAALWFSDFLLPTLVSGDLLRQYQLLKGAVEVLLTGGLVYVLVWYSQRALRSANDRLERNDEILQVLLRLLRHNIRNEMNIIQGHAETATNSADREDVEDSCSEILKTTNELLRRTETVNELREMLKGAADRTTFDLADLVETVSSEVVQQTGADARVTDEDVESVEVAANGILPVALGEVVDNAIRYNDSATPTVVFETVRDTDTVELSVTDDGPGIPDGELEALDAREESPLVHSSGLGLWFVHWVVTDSGGDVTFDVPDSGGTVVKLVLPLASAEEPLVGKDVPSAGALLGTD